MPDSIIEIPLQCKRESFSVPLAFAAFLGTLFSLALIFTGKYDYGSIGLILSLYLLKLAISWFFNLRRHFEFDSESGVVSQITIDKNNKEVKQITNSSEIDSFAVAGIKNRVGFAKRWWTYSVVMVLKNGKVFRVTTPSGDKHSKIAKKAVRLANAMGCKAFEGVHEQALNIKYTPAGVELSNRPWVFIDSFKNNGLDILYSLAFFAALLLLIIGLTITLS